MNEKAAELGLESTHYADPSGLLSDNVSSAYDMARLITHASDDERIALDHARRRPTRCTAKRARHHVPQHEPPARPRRLSMCGPAKTGFISKAGYCLATLLRLPQGGQQVAVVVLGARSNAGRFMETRESVQLAFGQGVHVFATATATTALQPIRTSRPSASQ